MEKRFKTPIKRISAQESEIYIPANEDFKNNFIHYYTLTPSESEAYPGSEGWDDVKYFTKRTKKPIPSLGEGKDIVYVMSNVSHPGLLKIGYTSKEVEIRRKDLSSASGVPTPFKVEFIYRLHGRGMELEGEIHSYLEDFRTSRQREFFEIGLKQAIDAVKKIGERYA